MEETDARLRMREVQHDTKHSSWQVGQKSQEDQMVSGEKEKSQEYQMVSSESFKQSKKDALKLVTQKEKNEIVLDSDGGENWKYFLMLWLTMQWRMVLVLLTIIWFLLLKKYFCV